MICHKLGKKSECVSPFRPLCCLISEFSVPCASLFRNFQSPVLYFFVFWILCDNISEFFGTCAVLFRNFPSPVLHYFGFFHHLVCIILPADDYPVGGALPAGGHPHRPHWQRLHHHRCRRGTVRHRLCPLHRHQGIRYSIVYTQFSSYTMLQ